MSAPVLFFDEIDSTNAEARRQAEAGEDGPLWLAADRQTAGRGRRGRAWSTEPGNLAATLLLTTDKPASQAAELSFVAAVAVCDFVRGWLPGADVKVKWPNDVLVGADKVAGLLLESGRALYGRIWVAIGVGVNLAHYPPGTDRPATAFASHIAAPPHPRIAVIGLSTAFGDWQRIWERDGFGPIAAAWTERAYGLGQPCKAQLETETVEGVAEGLDADGALRLRLADGTVRRITAGDVFFGGA